jgi:putative copper export protein
MGFFIAILLGAIFYWLSAKWLKQAYGGHVSCTERCIEDAMDFIFVISIAAFFVGLAFLLWFMVSAQAPVVGIKTTKCEVTSPQ